KHFRHDLTGRSTGLRSSPYQCNGRSFPDCPSLGSFGEFVLWNLPSTQLVRRVPVVERAQRQVRSPSFHRGPGLSLPGESGISGPVLWRPCPSFPIPLGGIAVVAGPGLAGGHAAVVCLSTILTSKDPHWRRACCIKIDESLVTAPRF